MEPTALGFGSGRLAALACRDYDDAPRFIAIALGSHPEKCRDRAEQDALGLEPSPFRAVFRCGTPWPLKIRQLLRFDQALTAVVVYQLKRGLPAFC